MNPALQQGQIQRHTLSQQMQQSIKILMMGLPELRTYLYEQQEANPLLEITEYDPVLVEYHPEHHHVRKSSETADSFSPELNIPQPRSYREELVETLNICAMSSAQIRCAKYIIAALDDDGYLRESLKEIAEETGCCLKDAESALSAVQDLDPAGIGARDLRECLLLQLRRSQQDDFLTIRIVADYLDDLAQHRYRYIANQLQIKEKQVRQISDRISSLSPRPAAIGSAPQYIVPDIIVQNAEPGLEVQINTRSLPNVTINYQYMELAQIDAACKSYLAPYRTQAQRTMYSLQFRTHTLTRVAEQIVKRQSDFFQYQAPLNPCSLHDLADELELSESTVSRAVNGKYLLCSHGVFPLRHFLSRSVKVEGGICSADDIRCAIADLIRQNGYISDIEMARHLSDQGITIARRTVAKYRAQLGVRASYGVSKK